MNAVNYMLGVLFRLSLYKLNKFAKTKQKQGFEPFMLQIQRCFKKTQFVIAEKVIPKHVGYNLVVMLYQSLSERAKQRNFGGNKLWPMHVIFITE